MLAAESKIKADHFGLPFAQRREGTLDFLAERFFHQLVIGSRLALILDNVQKPVVLPLGKRRIHREVAP